MRRLVRAVLLLTGATVGGLLGWYTGTLMVLGLILILGLPFGGSPPPSYPILLGAAALGALGGGTLAVWLARLAWRAER
jgi:hypothetical protein